MNDKTNDKKSGHQASAIAFLEKQHVQLRGLFAQMKDQTTEAGRRNLLEKVSTSLRNHSALEERHFYPGVLNKDTETKLSHSRKEHRQAEDALGKLFQCESFDEDFVKKFYNLVEDVQHHMQEEEGELFPMVANEVPLPTLTQLGSEMEMSFRMMTQMGPGIEDKVKTIQSNAAE